MIENKNQKFPGYLSTCFYFDNPRPENTQKTLEIAAKRAEELEVQNVIVASSSGKTGLMAARYFPARNLVIVTHSTGFLKPDYQELKAELREKIIEAGAKVLTCQNALGGVGRAARKKLQNFFDLKIMDILAKPRLF